MTGAPVRAVARATKAAEMVASEDARAMATGEPLVALETAAPEVAGAAEAAEEAAAEEPSRFRIAWTTSSTTAVRWPLGRPWMVGTAACGSPRTRSARRTAP